MRSGRLGSAVLLVALLVVVTACVGNRGGESPKDDAAISVGGAKAKAPAIGPNGEQQVIPTPLVASGGQGAGVATQRSATSTRRPPVPNLDSLRPTPPPDTVSLEELHERGEAHVLR